MAAPHPTPHLWLIGGTQESASLARAIVAFAIPCIITVTTESARSLYPAAPSLQIHVGKLTPDRLPLFLRDHAITAIVDASHPFATEVSQLAIATAQRHNLPYLRLERPSVHGSIASPTDSSIPSLPHLLATDLLLGQRVLLTLGYRWLRLFQPWQAKATLFARILPSQAALTAALDAGFTPDRLIALRPPISADLERSLWQHWHISLVVTKASGTPGGEDVKRQVAAELGVKLLVIDRPPLAYPQQTSDIEAAVVFCRKVMGM